MNNYQHDKIQKLEDFRNTNLMINRSVRKHITGFTQGSGKYEAPSKNKHSGPIVMGGSRYDTYQTTYPATYGTPVIYKQQSCMQKCCACLGKICCCLCLCDLLT